MTSDLPTRVNRGLAWIGASSAVIAIFDVVSMVLVGALFLSSRELGIAMTAMAFYPLFDTAVDLGIAAALIQRDDHSPERLSTVFWFNALLSVALIGIVLAVAMLVGATQSEPVIGTLIAVYAVKLVIQNVYAIPLALLRKQLRFAELARLRVVAHVSESIARVVFAALGYAIWCFVLAILVRATIFAIGIAILHPYRPSLVFRFREIRGLVGFGLQSSASAALYYLYTNLDYVVVTYCFGPAATGVYTLAYQIVLEPVRTITNVVSDIAFPTFARLRHTRAALVDQFITFARLDLIGVLPFVMVIALVIPDFLATFYGGGRWTAAQLEDSAAIARILCVVGVLRALGFLGPPLLDGIGRPGLTLRYMACTALFVTAGFVVSAAVLGPGLGVRSVAVGWAVFYPLAFLILARLVTVAIDLPLRRYLTQTRGIVAVAAVATLAGVVTSHALAAAPPAVRMVAVAVTSLAVMFGLLARFEGVTPRAIKAAM